MTCANDSTVYDVGDEVKIIGSLTNADGDLFDPDAVEVKYLSASGVESTLTYGVDADLVREGTGTYSTNINVTESGLWHYRFSSTGVGQAADEGSFYVDPSAF